MFKLRLNLDRVADLILASKDADRLDAIWVLKNRIYTKFHYRARVISYEGFKPFIQNAYDKTFSYPFKSKRKAKEFYNGLIESENKGKYIWKEVKKLT